MEASGSYGVSPLHASGPGLGDGLLENVFGGSVPSITKLAWQDFMEMTLNLAESLVQEGGPPDVLIGVARGGLPLLTALASYFRVSDVGVAFVRSTVTDDPFSSRLPTVDCRSLALPDGAQGRSVVIVDDIIRSGRTIGAVLDKLESKAWSTVRVASLYAEPQLSDLPLHCVRVVDHTNWIVFPWDDWPRPSVALSFDKEHTMRN